jgi:hypothetical protein
VTREEFLAAVNLLDQNGDFGVVPGPLGERINLRQGFPLSIVIGSLQVNSVVSLDVSTGFGLPLLVIGREADLNVTVAPFEAMTAVIGPIQDP